MPAPQAVPPSSSQGASLPPSRRRRLQKRLLVGASAFVVLALLAVSLASWHLWRQRVAYTRHALQLVLPAFNPSLDQLDISSSNLRLAGLALQEKDAPRPFASLRSLSLSGWRHSLRHPHSLDRLHLDGLRLAAPSADLPRLLAALLPPASPPAPPAAGSPSPLPLFSLARLDLSDFQVRLQGDDLFPHLEFNLDHSLQNLHISPSSPPSLKTASFELSRLILRTPDGSSLSIPRLSLTLSFDSQSGFLHIHLLDLPSESELTLLPALTQYLARFQSGGSDSTTPPWFKGVILEHVTLPDLALSAPRGLSAATSKLTARARLALDSRDTAWHPGQPLSRLGSHHLTLSDLSLHLLDNSPGHLRFPRITLDSRFDAPSSTWHIDQFDAPDLDLLWTPALEAALLPTSSPSPTPASPAASAPRLLFARSSLSDARLRIEKTTRLPFDLDCLLDLSTRDLLLQNLRLTSSQPQHLSLRSITARFPGSHTAAPTTIDSLSAILRPDALLSIGLIDRLHIDKPRLTYRLDLNPGSPSPAPPSPPTPSLPASPFSLPPPLDKLHFAHLAVTDGTLKLSGRWGADFEAETRFHLVTDPVDSVGSPASRHTLSIDETRLLATGGKPLPVAQIGRLQVQARLPRLLTERRLDSLSLTGGQIEFGEALSAILDPGTPSAKPAPASPPPPSSAPKWSSDQVAVSDLSITLQKIAPGLPPLTFAVQFDAQNAPLEPAGLVENLDPQRVELSSLTLSAPYGSPHPVARLDTIFVHFTLDSLLRQRIDKVEIVSPTLYVGEPLFWYVDYYRKFAGGGIKSNADIPRMALADTGSDTALAAASQTLSSPPPPPAWAVEEIEVHAGKLVLAPKGVPLPGFGQPFPFSFKTRLDSGQFDAVFDIPPDNYPFEKLKLEFLGMKGQVRFNMPMKNVSNNLTETFWVDQIRWKQLHVEKAHMSVTYDLNGIYGKFGGEAYQGYIEGGFDIYLNDSYTWDGWIAATDIRTREITEKLTPAYFLLDGTVNGTLVATGDAKHLYQADITCGNATSGRFSIAALNEMLGTLPPRESATITNQITRIGLETLRDFEYDKVEAKATFHGREGAGHLKISGPSGSRNFEINVLDHRWKSDPPAALSATP